MSSPRTPHQTATLLNAIGRGEKETADSLVSLFHDEIQQLASRMMSKEREGHTLQATAIVNELYLRLVHQRTLSTLGRSEFLSLCSRLIRQVLLDHAKAAHAVKRGGGAARVTLLESAAVAAEDPISLLDLEVALRDLSVLDPRHAQLVELKFFAGATNREIADVLSVSVSTVEKDWRFVRAWLRAKLNPGKYDT